MEEKINGHQKPEVRAIRSQNGIEQTERNRSKREENKAKFLEAYMRIGYITKTCRAIGISTSTVTVWRKNDEVFAQAFKEVEALRLDYAEEKLQSMIHEQNSVPCLIFYLKTKGKDRGYTERHELTGAENTPLIPTIQIASPDSVLPPVSSEREVEEQFLLNRSEDRIGEDE